MMIPVWSVILGIGILFLIGGVLWEAMHARWEVDGLFGNVGNGCFSFIAGLIILALLGAYYLGKTLDDPS